MKKTFYRYYVRSKLDYGCVVYGSARQSVLESLDRVQNAALRTCLAAFRTSPVASLYIHVEAGELPLELQHQQLYLQYIYVNFDQIHVTLLSVVYLVLTSDACLRLDQIPSHTWCQIESNHS